MRALAALVLALEQGAAGILVAPAVHRRLGGAVEGHLVLDALDPAAGNAVVHPAGIGIGLGEDDPVAAHLVDLADRGAVGADHLHMLGHLAEHLALALALLPPAAELLLELGLMLAPIFVIVAVEILDLPPAPFRIMRIVDVAAEAAAGAF